MAALKTYKKMIGKIPSRIGRVLAHLFSLAVLLFFVLAVFIQSFCLWLNSDKGSIWLNEQLSYVQKDSSYNVILGNFHYAWPLAIGISRLEVTDKQTGQKLAELQEARLSASLLSAMVSEAEVSLDIEKIAVYALPAQAQGKEKLGDQGAWDAIELTGSPVSKIYLGITVNHLQIAQPIVPEGFETSLSFVTSVDIIANTIRANGVLALENTVSDAAGFIPSRLEYRASANLEDGQMTFPSLKLEALGYNVDAAGGYNLADKNFFLTTNIRMLKPGDYVSPAFSKPIEMGMSFSGSQKKASGDINITSEVQGKALSLSAPLELDTGKLILADIKGSLAENKLSGNIELDTERGELTNGYITLDVASLGVMKEFVPDLDISGSGKITAQLAPDMNLNGIFKNITYMGDAFSEASFTAVKKENVPQIDFRILSSTPQNFKLTGRVLVPDTKNLHVSLRDIRATTGAGYLTINGDVTEPEISLDLSAKSFDITQAPFVGLSESPLSLMRATGRIAGSFSRPELDFDGNWQLAKGHKNAATLTTKISFRNEHANLDVTGSGKGINSLIGKIDLPLQLSLSPYKIKIGKMNGSLDGDFTLGPLLRHIPMNSFKVDGQSRMHLEFSGPEDNKFNVSGVIDPEEIKIDLPSRFETSIPRLNIVEAGKKGEGLPSSLSVQLDILFDAPNRIFVRGWGLDTEFGGKLGISGDAASPDIDGTLSSIRGRYEEFGKKFSLDRAILRFDGKAPPSPYFDIVTSTEAGDVTAQILIGGNAEKPEIKLASTPVLPEDEVLSRILFGTSSGQISPFQAVQLAQALKKFSSGSSGTDFFNPLVALRNITGLDDITVDGVGTEGATIGAGKYITDKVYVDVKSGTAENSGSASVKIKLTPEVSVESSANQSGSAGGSVFWEWDY
ncbi:MAG: translocation/assembly module TamB domain-containing protein [Pseudobdellovibrionaceae bacterium]|jgi:hypothetical protein|nr:translocation/assembly module TamB domain-containing protein [Pseudobdellovibrionaceae bacterium]